MKGDQYVSTQCELMRNVFVVIGGEKVAGFKIIPLLKQGADIVVISPELDANLVKLVEEKKIRWYQREKK